MTANSYRHVVSTDTAPKAIGPYSQAITFNDLVFPAGQIALDYRTGQLVEGGIEAQTRQVMENLKAILEAAGSSLDSVLKTTIFLTNLDDFGKVNTIYGEYFTQEPPARSTVQVAGLPRGGLVEIECVAALDS